MQLCHRDCNRQQLPPRRSRQYSVLVSHHSCLGHKPFCNTPQISPTLYLHCAARMAWPTAEQSNSMHWLHAWPQLQRSERRNVRSQKPFDYHVTQKLNGDSYSAPQWTATRFIKGSSWQGTKSPLGYTSWSAVLGCPQEDLLHGFELGHSQVELAIHFAGQRKKQMTDGCLVAGRLPKFSYAKPTVESFFHRCVSPSLWCVEELFRAYWAYMLCLYSWIMAYCKCLRTCTG